MFISKNGSSAYSWKYDASQAACSGTVIYVLSEGPQLLQPGVTRTLFWGGTESLVATSIVATLQKIAATPGVIVALTQYTVEVIAEDPQQWLYELRGLVAGYLSEIGGGTARVTAMAKKDFPDNNEFMNVLKEKAKENSELCQKCSKNDGCKEIKKPGFRPVAIKEGLKVLKELGFKGGIVSLQVPGLGIIVIPIECPPGLGEGFSGLHKFVGKPLPAILFDDCHMTGDQIDQLMHEVGVNVSGGRVKAKFTELEKMINPDEDQE